MAHANDYYTVGDRVQIYLDAKFWKSEGWSDGTVIRIDPYSGHRNFTWVELDTAVRDSQGGMVSILSVLNPKHIKKME